LIPLSYATILGGTCTAGWYAPPILSFPASCRKIIPGTPAGDIGLFDVGVYGVPNMLHWDDLHAVYSVRSCCHMERKA
jgi:hypothetical protein